VSERISIAVVSHVVTDEVAAMFARLKREAPADHDVRLILNADAPDAPTGAVAEADVVRIRRDELFRLPYPRKCQAHDWDMAGNLDVAFLEFARRLPFYPRYWFVEYDVHWEGDWRVFFDYFRRSDAEVLAATLQHIDEVPHKENNPPYPAQIIPPGTRWERAHIVKAFLPICRIGREALAALDLFYRNGGCGHYEITVASIAAQNGMRLEDFGGDGSYVRPENRNRFYFAHGTTYSHSPGNFVFRPVQRVLPRRNTLWHPVKPEGVPAWHPLRVQGGLAKSAIEAIKPAAWRLLIRLWFALRWRPLIETSTVQGNDHL
jgi:hypothetical protein